MVDQQFEVGLGPLMPDGALNNIEVALQKAMFVELAQVDAAHRMRWECRGQTPSSKPYEMPTQLGRRIDHGRPDAHLADPPRCTYTASLRKKGTHDGRGQERCA